MIRALSFAMMLVALPFPAWDGALAAPASATGGRHVFLLSAPISQKIKGSCGVVGAVWSVNLAWSAAIVGGSYLCFHDPVSAGFLTAWNIPQNFIYSAGGIRTANELTARWRRRKDLRRIAESSGAREMRVITTGSSQQLGLFNASLDSQSFIFVEKDGAAPPPPYHGRDWLPVGDLERTKVRMHFDLPGHERDMPPLELSLRELFEGTRISPEVEQAWRDGIKEWNERLPLWERYVTQRTFNSEARVAAELVKDGEVLALGDYASGASIKQMLGMSNLQAARRFLEERFLGRDAGPRISSQGVAVHDSGACSKWYRRIMGREILVTP